MTIRGVGVRVLGLTLMLALLVWPAQTKAAPGQRVGLQAGHWRSNELPDELASLRTSTGAIAGGYREYEVNLNVAERAAAYLRAVGITVDVLPATVPQSYYADAFVAIHADGNSSTAMSGWKASASWREWEASTALVEAMKAEYGPASGLRWDGEHISSGMRGYYAMSSRRFKHTISTYTPAIILEMGYLTNPRDRQLMTAQADRLAQAVANGVLRFLNSTPEGGWPSPPPLPDLRATVVTSQANLRGGPGTNYPIVRTVSRGRTLLISEERGDWLKVYSYRNNNRERWVRRDLVSLERISDEPPRDGSGVSTP